MGKLPFFQNRDHAFMGSIVPILQPVRMVENEYIFSLDDHPYDSKGLIVIS